MEIPVRHTDLSTTIPDTLLISIIVPVYKAEKYLNRCVESIVAQTYQNWELLLVEDGSPDNSSILCDLWTAQDRRIKVFHKANGGVSSARNLGIENANGDWITFIDSDDWVSGKYLELFVSNLNYGERTIYLQGIQMFTIHKGLSPMFSYDDEFYSIEKQPDLFVKNRVLADGCPVAKLFNRKVLIDNDIRFENTISINEDHLFVLSYYKYIDNICTISLVSYFYYYDFTTPSLTKISHSYLELQRVSFLMNEAFKLICVRFGLSKEDLSGMIPIFGPNQAVKSILSCIDNNEKISSFRMCEKYLSENFGLSYDKYDRQYRKYLMILSTKYNDRIKYFLFKVSSVCNNLIHRVKYRLKLLFWKDSIKKNKL